MNEKRFDRLRQYNCLFSEIDSAYHEIAVRMGISDSTATILYALSCSGSRCPLNEICRNTGLSKQTANSAIRKLEAEGMLRLEAIDGRAKMAVLTEAGCALARRTVIPVMEMEDRIYSSWTEAEREQYLHLNERFLEALKEQIPTM